MRKALMLFMIILMLFTIVASVTTTALCINRPTNIGLVVVVTLVDAASIVLWVFALTVIARSLKDTDDI